MEPLQSDLRLFCTKCLFQMNIEQALTEGWACPKCDGSLTSAQGPQEMCDFCGLTDVKWAYIIEPFEAPRLKYPPDLQFVDHLMPREMMTPGWAACSVCSDLIEARDIDGLENHCNKVWLSDGSLDGFREDMVAAMIDGRKEMHMMFLERLARSGSPRIPNAEYTDTDQEMSRRVRATYEQ